VNAHEARAAENKRGNTAVCFKSAVNGGTTGDPEREGGKRERLRIRTEGLALAVHSFSLATLGTGSDGDISGDFEARPPHPH